MQAEVRAIFHDSALTFTPRRRVHVITRGFDRAKLRTAPDPITAQQERGRLDTREELQLQVGTQS